MPELKRNIQINIQYYPDIGRVRIEGDEEIISCLIGKKAAYTLDLHPDDGKPWASFLCGSREESLKITAELEDFLSKISP